MIRGIRGAITVDENTETAIYVATRKLLNEIISVNHFHSEDIVSVLATVTDDLDAAFPAMAIRSIPGWDLVPMMCAREIPVPGSLRMCIRVMIHVNTDLSLSEVRHVYLREAANLRPDLTSKA